MHGIKQMPQSAECHHCGRPEARENNGRVRRRPYPDPGRDSEQSYCFTPSTAAMPGRYIYILPNGLERGTWSGEGGAAGSLPKTGEFTWDRLPSPQ